MPSADFFTRSSEQFGGKISFVVTDVIARLRAMGAVHVEGLFRLNSSLSEEQRLCVLLNEGRINLSSVDNALTLANVLKRYYRCGAPLHPLIPFGAYDRFVRIAAENCAEEFRALFAGISRSNYRELALLMTFLHEVAEHSDENKMDAANLARMFGPNLLRERGASADAISTAAHDARNLPLQWLIERAPEVFAGFAMSDEYVLTDEEIKAIAPRQYSEQDVRDSLKLRELRMQSQVQYVPHEFLFDPTSARLK